MNQSKEDSRQTYGTFAPGPDYAQQAEESAADTAVWLDDGQTNPEVEATNGDLDSPEGESEGFEELIDTSSPEAVAEAYETGWYGDKPIHAGEYAPSLKQTKTWNPSGKNHRTLV